MSDRRFSIFGLFDEISSFLVSTHLFPLFLQTLRQMQSTMSNAQQQSVDMASLIEPRDSIAEGADSLAEGGDSLTDGEDSETSTNPERRQLSNKLRELQDKRSQMEHLLGELQTLREYRKHNGKLYVSGPQ